MDPSRSKRVPMNQQSCQALLWLMSAPSRGARCNVTKPRCDGGVRCFGGLSVPDVESPNAPRGTRTSQIPLQDPSPHHIVD
jgi:hypothetical protein